MMNKLLNIEYAKIHPITQALARHTCRQTDGIPKTTFSYA
jgi:hypothetical protein